MMMNSIINAESDPQGAIDQIKTKGHSPVLRLNSMALVSKKAMVNPIGRLTISEVEKAIQLNPCLANA